MLLMRFSTTIGHMAGRPRTRAPRAHETSLQTLFVKRVKQEMADQGVVSITELSRRTGAPPQRTLQAVLNEGVVPGLTVVHGIAEALNIRPWELMLEKKREAEVVQDKVRPFPVRYKPWSKNRTVGKTPKRNTSGAGE